ncbi:protein FAR1-RELATED SEQUENCE 5-like [Vicia villosa]|uniref:protein FAR1-RELATED SEQUENCE 5-like n=1 Tax=Vicia villosa TaxID=3911 RepID=UPI00273CE03B|nr:protein FAR1-RELATED SEQUENCE 5-like [Vicia villosa]
MLTWIRRTTTRLGFDVVIGISNNGLERRNVFVTMLCERSGKYHIPLRKFKRDDTGSRKCECPFKIRGYMLATKKWKFSVICGLHNHELYSKLQGHPSVCRLKPEENTCISDMILNFVQPKNILATLKWKKPGNVSNISQVYNIWYCTNKAIRGDRNEMQQLLKLLDDNSYVSRYRTCNDRVTVRNIFWTHPNLMKLFNTFSTVLILDSTYDTNKYRLPLFEMIGVTSTKKTYSVGFAFLECEKEDNFTWALEVCQSLLKEQFEMPKEIIMDRDTALMNVVAKVFPSANALFFRYHITTNVRSRVKPAVGMKQVEAECGKLVKGSVTVE